MAPIADGEIDHGADSPILPRWIDGVDGQRQAEGDHVAARGELARMGAAVTGDVVGIRGSAVLDGELDMVEAGLRQGVEACAGRPDARR